MNTAKKLDVRHELSNTQDKQNSLINHEEVKDTPFTIQTELNEKEEEISYVRMGKWRLTEWMSKKECEKWIKDINWNKIVQISMIIKLDANINEKIIQQ